MKISIEKIKEMLESGEYYCEVNFNVLDYDEMGNIKESELLELSLVKAPKRKIPNPGERI